MSEIKHVMCWAHVNCSIKLGGMIRDNLIHNLDLDGRDTKIYTLIELSHC